MIRRNRSQKTSRKQKYKQGAVEKDGSQPVNGLKQSPPVNGFNQRQPVNGLGPRQPVNRLKPSPPVNGLEQNPPVNRLEQSRPAVRTDTTTLVRCIFSIKEVEEDERIFRDTE